MKALLIAVGVILALDGGFAVLMLLIWAARGHVPDFIAPTAFGVWSIVMVALKTAGGLTGAILLWNLKPLGRVISGIVAAHNVAYAIVAATRASALSATVWAVVALNAAMLVVVALPAAGDAMRPARRPLVRPVARSPR